MPHKTAAQTPNDDLDTEIALFRYGLIAPMLHDPPTGGQQETLLRAIAAKRYRIPGSTRTQVSTTTLRRYLTAYRAGGFEALRPVTRGDAGVPRALPPEVLARAIALREEQPAAHHADPGGHLTTRRQPALAHPINVHTLTTHLRRAGKTRRLLAQRPTAYRRFEREQVNALWQGDALVGPWLPDPVSRARNAERTCFASSTTIAGWCPTPNSSTTRRCPAWNACSRSPSCAAACPKRSMSTTARSIPPPNSAPPAPLWASAASTPRPTHLKAKANRKDFSRPSGPSSCPRSKRPISPPWRNSTRPCGPGSSASTTSTALGDRPDAPGPLYRRSGPGPHGRPGNAAPGLPVARAAQGAPGRHPLPARQPLPGRPPSGRAHRRTALRPVRPEPHGTVPGRRRPGHGHRHHAKPPAPPGRRTPGDRALEPAKPKSALDFLAALRAEHQEQQRRELGRLEFARLLPADTTTAKD